MFEEYNVEFFESQAKELGDQLGVDTRKGSVYMDMAEGHCIRAAFFMSNLAELFTMFALDTCYADVLDDKAKEWGLTRHDATPATFKAVYDGERPAVGSRFFAENTVYYFIAVLSEDPEDEDLYFESETPGADVNVLSPGTALIPVTDIEGLNSASLGEIEIMGADEESDDSFRSRLRNKLAASEENGNRAHYKSWCESIDGVGRAKIEPLFAGENTVRAILFGPDGSPASDSVVAQVQEYVDPIVRGYPCTDEHGDSYIAGDGLGNGVANLGAHFLAQSAELLDIDVSFDVTLIAGATIAECIEAAEEAITDYLQSITVEVDDDSTVIIRIASIGALITELPQVIDYENLKLNGGTVNITAGTNEAPVLREVVANATN